MELVWVNIVNKLFVIEIFFKYKLLVIRNCELDD